MLAILSFGNDSKSSHLWQPVKRIKESHTVDRLQLNTLFFLRCHCSWIYLLILPIKCHQMLFKKLSLELGSAKNHNGHSRLAPEVYPSGCLKGKWLQTLLRLLEGAQRQAASQCLLGPTSLNWRHWTGLLQRTSESFVLQVRWQSSVHSFQYIMLCDGRYQ